MSSSKAATTETESSSSRPFAADLVRLQVDLILAAAPPAPEAARGATSTIPIVMANHADPVASRLVTSLARPGGNVTGLSMLSREMRVKQLQLLREILPHLTRVAFLQHPDIPLDVKDSKSQRGHWGSAHTWSKRGHRMSWRAHSRRRRDSEQAQ